MMSAYEYLEAYWEAAAQVRDLRARLSAAEAREKDLRIEITELQGMLTGCEKALAAAEAREKRTLGLIRSMAVNGPGEGTTAEQALETIAHFCDKRLTASEPHNA